MASDNVECPPGLWNKETIAYYLQRRRCEKEIFQSRIRQLEIENEQLRQQFHGGAQFQNDSTNLSHFSSVNNQIEKMKISLEKKSTLRNQVSSVRKDLNNIQKAVKTMQDEFYTSLANVRHYCRIFLKPNYLEEMVSTSATENGYIYVKKSDLEDMMKVVMENITAVAENLEEAASRSSLPQN